jgi:hypothetical protein
LNKKLVSYFISYGYFRAFYKKNRGQDTNFFGIFYWLKIFFLAACFLVGFAVLGTGFEGEKSGVVICVIGEGKIANIISL